MNYRAAVNWATVQEQPQVDWVDHIVSVESWLERNVGAKGELWDWFNGVACSQVGFERERDLMWFVLAWS